MKDMIAKLAELEKMSQTLDWTMHEQLNVALSEITNITKNFFKARPSALAITQEPVDKHVVLDEHVSAIGLNHALNNLVNIISHSGIDTANACFLGYVPGGGLPTAAATNYITSLFNRYVGMYAASPGAAMIENESLAWLIKIFDFPESAWGTFTSGGSTATITALIAGRDAAPIKDKSQLIYYMSDQTHLANHRALHVIGVEEHQIRKIPTDSSFRMNINALNDTIKTDLSNSLRPWIVIANAGTTNTGSIDPIDKIADLCEKYKMWLHVDAAYGGMFALLPQLKSQMNAISRANSLIIDPHKGMFLPYGCGAVLVANGELLRSALMEEGAYLADIEDHQHHSANEYSIELTRPSRGAQLWAVLKAHGQDAIVAALEEKLLLAEFLHRRLCETQYFDVIKTKDLSVVVFRLPAGDEATKKLLDHLTQQGRYLLSSTLLNNKLYLRCCVLCFRTHKRDIDGLCDELLKFVI